MDKKRLAELLAYAKVCFEHCTNPFENMHLIKKKVTADECRDLSAAIADIIEDSLIDFYDSTLMLSTQEVHAMIEQAEKEFAETQS